MTASKQVNSQHSQSWMASRVRRTSGSLSQAFEEGLTGHEIVSREGKEVRLTNGSTAVEFVSCSYLGLESHPALREAASKALSDFGVHLSTSRNRMRPYYLRQLEEQLEEIHGTNVVAFTSVSAVHLGVLPTLAVGALPGYRIGRDGPAFLVEKTAHSSMQILRGVFEQFGPTSRFDITEPGSLDECLATARRSSRTPIVLVDGVGSMGGLIDVRSVYETTRGSDGILYVDDAHGTSILGTNGCGYTLSEMGESLPEGMIVAGSMSKAFGGSGGFAVVRGSDVATALPKYANSLVFGHSIMLPLLAANVAAAQIHLSPEIVVLQDKLHRNLGYFDELTNFKLINAGTKSPIRGLQFSDEDQTFQAARRLRDDGVLILPAFFPTVAEGHGLIRFGLSSLHRQKELRIAAQVVSDAL